MPLSDNQAYDRLHAALQALGNEEAETVRAKSALEVARRTLAILQFALVYAGEHDQDELPGVKPLPPPS